MKFGILFIFGLVNADCYMQTPRGSNNKLNEQSNTVTNDNRLFDSQNNAQSGYQVGDKCIPNCLNDTNNQYNRDAPGAGQGIMEYYEGSELWIDWTNQHGSQSAFLRNNIVLQYMCNDGEYSTGIRDGKTTDTIPTDPNAANIQDYGQHENHKWYDLCKTRTRNKGLYTADQNLQGDTAIYTRQRANGERFGLECAEERDYYPYWHPTPWRDIMVCTDTPYQCPYYYENSQNGRDKGLCSLPLYNNQNACQQMGGTWKESGAWNIPAPNCTICPKTRNNHNGNADGSLNSPNYLWTVPTGIHADGASCVLRIRYNISTADFNPDPWSVFSDKNGNNAILKTNPAADFVGLGLEKSGPLRLNVNTAQFGRVFEDRTHVFKIKKRPSNLNCGLKAPGDCRIINLNVRGRRGNIQQTYPAVEYDFVPPVIVASRNDFLHIQWTGSDANDQNNAGNGRAGTDRNNLVIISNLAVNKPTTMNELLRTNSTPTHFTNDINMIAYLAYLNQTGCDPDTQNANANNNCKQLNNSPGYVNAGLVKVDNVGTFYYMSTRNNAFSNREQKAVLVVKEDVVTATAATAIGVAGVGLLATAAFGLLTFMRKKRANLAGAETPVDGFSSSQANLLAQQDWAEKNPRKAKIAEWYLWNRPKIWFFFFFATANIVSGVYGILMNLNPKYPPYFPYAKMCGKMLDFNLCFVLVLVMRNFISFLRTTAVNERLPLDDNLQLHRWTAYTIAVTAIGHIVFHSLDFIYQQNYEAVPVYMNVFATLPGITGVLITLSFLCMFFSAFLKRKIYSLFGKRFDGYKVFLSIHRLWIPIYALLCLHGSQFWQYVCFPLFFIALEKYIQASRAKVDVQLVGATMVGRDVLNLKMRLGSGKKKFRYKAGQYLFLCCPAINESEYHPFTITSAPEENYFSVHIRCRQDMDWTYSLRELLGYGSNKPGEKGTAAAGKQPEVMKMSNMSPLKSPSNAELSDDDIILRVDGPYGSASEDVFDYESVILVGAGIGVTPFISILKSLSIRINQGDFQNQMSIYFYWICRDQNEFDSFKNFFEEIVSIGELQSQIELNMYVTGELDLKNVKDAKYNQYSGRPNWNRIFKEKAQKHKGTEIGVFLCGPSAIAKQLELASKAHSSKRLPKGKTADEAPTFFKFHKENF